jgi:MATE family multidrug resistance protein
MTGIVVMQFVDALFLSWHSADAISAVVPAGMASFFIMSPFQATAGYTSTLVAHYTGAGKPERTFAATAQGMCFGIISGVIVFALAFIADPLFTFVGHEKNVQDLEVIFFKWMCWGAAPSIVGSAVSGYFIGIGRTKLLMIIQLFGIGCNAILDYLLIFGKFGFPELGITGAAIATIISQCVVLILLLVKFYTIRDSGGMLAFNRCQFEKTLFWRLIRFGIPSGLRFGFEMLAWTAFILIVGRVGINELAATNIAFRINGFAFFPVIGIGQAVGILVGQAQGAQKYKESIKITYAGFILAEAWMIIAALFFVLMPETLFTMFKGDSYADFNSVLHIGIILLKFVAVYSLLDACNIIFVSALQAAGDTRWTMIVSIIAHIVFLGILVVADINKSGIWIEWAAAAAFVMIVALVWYLRFRSDKWHHIQVIEMAEYQND